MTDHRAYYWQIHISESPKRPTRWRFNVSLLPNPTSCEQFETELNKFILMNKNSVDDPIILWATTKGFY